MSKKIKRSTSPEGYIDLSFRTKGSRVGEDSYMPLALVILLVPASFTVSSPVAVMFYDKVASRNEFQYGVAMIWVLLALLLWAGVVYTFNHRRSVKKNKMRIAPKESVRGLSLFSYDSYKDFVVRIDNSLGYTSDISYVAAVSERRKEEDRVTGYMSDEQAEAIVKEINKCR